MSLDKPGLITKLRLLFNKTINSAGTADEAEEEFVQDLATIIDDYTKSAKVVYSGGLYAGSNPVYGTFNHTIE